MHATLEAEAVGLKPAGVNPYQFPNPDLNSVPVSVQKCVGASFLAGVDVALKDPLRQFIRARAMRNRSFHHVLHPMRLARYSGFHTQEGSHHDPITPSKRR